MKHRHLVSLAIVSLSTSVVGVTLAQDRFTLKSPSGIAFSELKGYDTWQVIASSHTDDGSGCGASPDPGCIKSIVGNPVMVQAYADGIPANGKPVPDGAMLAKIEWTKARILAAPYGVTVPGRLAEVSFMMKDSSRFPATNGWGYATFRYDEASDSWTAFGAGPEFVNSCHGCHTVVRGRDFVWTGYPKR